MTPTVTLWLVIIGAGIGTFFTRVSFIALFARREMPPLLRRGLRYVPAAMLTAIVVAGVAIPGKELAVTDTLYLAKLFAALVAAIVAWRTRGPVPTIAAGMLALWGAQWTLQQLR
jgi:branched-subunit amino acid transport protein